MGAQGSLLCEQMLEDVGFEIVQAEDHAGNLFTTIPKQKKRFSRKKNLGIYERQHPNDFWVCSLYEYANAK